jgi:hypothetical protein
MAGANSIFAGDKLLTTPNPSFEEDNQMFELLGLKPRVAFKDEKESESNRHLTEGDYYFSATGIGNKCRAKVDRISSQI